MLKTRLIPCLDVKDGTTSLSRALARTGPAKNRGHTETIKDSLC